MIEISKIERSNRKTLSVSVTSSGEVIIKAPLKLPATEIEKFIKEKQGWIESKRKKATSVSNTFKEIIEYKKLLILGESYHGFSSPSVSKITLMKDRILIPSKITPDKLHKKITNWYKTLADNTLIPRVKEIARLINILPSTIKCTGSRGRFGACNNKKEIFLNWRIIMLPSHLIDYVIIHELAHILELNHSPKFWNIVETLLPDFKSRRNELKTYSFILKLF